MNKTNEQLKLMLANTEALIDFSDEDDADYLYSTSNPRRSKRNLKNLKNQKLKFEEPALHPTRRRHASAAKGNVLKSLLKKCVIWDAQALMITL